MWGGLFVQAVARVGGGSGAEGARHELLISRNAETLCFWDGVVLLLFISAVKMPAGVSGRTSQRASQRQWGCEWVGGWWWAVWGGGVGVQWGWLVWKLTSVL